MELSTALSPGIPREQLCSFTAVCITCMFCSVSLKCSSLLNSRYGQWYVFGFEDICLPQAFTIRFGKFTELLLCGNTKSASETEISKLTVTFLIWKFCATSSVV